MAKIITGQNDFATQNPILFQEWNWEKNEELGFNPYKLGVFSNKKTWWICSKGHPSWESSIGNRTRGNGCPYCAGKLPIIGKTDLQTLYPELCKEWDYVENSPLMPTMITKGYSKKVGWICPVGHRWKAVVSSRTSGKGCPYCKDFGTSFPEQAILFYISQIFKDSINRDTSFGFELDIYIPSIKVAIEYDGFMFHNKEGRLGRDNKKDALCKDKGIRLIRIREIGLEDTISAYIIQRSDASNASLSESISKLCSYLNINVDINIERDHIQIMEKFYKYVKEHNFESIYPVLAKEWHPTKNGCIKPNMVSPFTSHKVWWLCPSGHAYDMSPAKRSSGRGCRYCAHQEVVRGETDLLACKPEIAKDWDYELNDALPSEVTSNTHSKVYYWICRNGHPSYPMTIANRNQGKGCPYCGHQKHMKKDSFGFLYPYLVSELYPGQEVLVDPYSTGPKSDKEVRWLCTKGHDWVTKVKKRTDGQGCPYCSNNKVWPGYNDFETYCKNNNLEYLLEEWDYESNNEICPSKIPPTKNIKIIWKCRFCSEQYSALLSNRVLL